MRDWKSILGAVAPALAGALGGPLAGVAVNTLMQSFGVKTEEELQNAIVQSSPEQIVELRKLDQDFKLKYLEAEIADKRSARDMQIAALSQDDRFSKRFVYYFAIAWSAAAIAYISGITFLEIPPDNLRFADTTLGFMLGTVISGIVQYFYGSSFGSRMKDERKL